MNARRLVLACALAMLALAACAPDRGACLQSHRETYMVPVLVGKAVIVVPSTRRVCDVWEYPTGKPEGGAL